MIKLLDIIEENTSNDVKTAVQKIDNLAQQVDNINNQSVQEDFLDQLIKTNFNLDKINPEQITEYYSDLKEAAVSSLKNGVKLLTPKLLQKIAKALRIDVQKVENALTWVKKIVGYSSDVIDKLFFTIARYLGTDINDAKVAGRGGLALVSLVGIIYGLIHFPAIVATITGSLGLIGLAKLGYALIKSISDIKTMWEEIKSAIFEHAQYTTSDFLDDIEKKYMETEGSKGKKIPTDWAYDLLNWYNSLDKQKQESVSIRMKQLAQVINSGNYKSMKGLIDTYLNKIGNTDSKVIFNTIQSYIELDQKGVKVSDQFKQSSIQEIKKLQQLAGIIPMLG